MVFGKRQWGRRGLIGLVAVVMIVTVVLGLAYAFQRKLIYLPAGGSVPAAAEVLPGGRDVTLHTSDGLDLGAWYFPVDEPKATVLAAPGNAGNRTLRAPLARALNARGLSVLLLEYRGFGGNPGDPTERGLALDARAARDFLVHHAGVPEGQLIYFGASLGAGVITELATEFPPAGMVLRSPFTDLAAAGQRAYPFLPVRLLLEESYPVLAQAREIDVPSAVVYGSADETVPPAQSRAVARAAGARMVEVPGADHNDPALSDGKLLIDAIVALS